MAVAPANSAVHFAPVDPTLPPPWKGLVDGSTGYLYYWNTETNVTQYEKPLPPQAPTQSGPPLPLGPPPGSTPQVQSQSGPTDLQNGASVEMSTGSFPDSSTANSLSTTSTLNQGQGAMLQGNMYGNFGNNPTGHPDGGHVTSGPLMGNNSGGGNLSSGAPGVAPGFWIEDRISMAEVMAKRLSDFYMGRHSSRLAPGRVVCKRVPNCKDGWEYDWESMTDEDFSRFLSSLRSTSKGAPQSRFVTTEEYEAFRRRHGRYLALLSKELSSLFKGVDLITPLKARKWSDAETSGVADVDDVELDYPSGVTDTDDAQVDYPDYVKENVNKANKSIRSM